MKQPPDPRTAAEKTTWLARETIWRFLCWIGRWVDNRPGRLRGLIVLIFPELSW